MTPLALITQAWSRQLDSSDIECGIVVGIRQACVGISESPDHTKHIKA